MAPRARRTAPLALEALERRNLLTGGLTAWLDGDTLHVEGTNADDVVRIRQGDEAITVDYTLIQTADQQAVKRLPAALVARVDVRGRGGDELVHLICTGSDAEAIPVSINVGAGNNRVVIDGEAGRWQAWVSAGSTLRVEEGQPQFLSGQVGEEPPLSAPSPEPSSPFRVEASQLLDRINDYRAAQGLTALRLDGDLGEAAAYQAEYMARTGVYAHENADGRGMVDRVLAAGYHYDWVGEVLHRYNPANRRTAGIDRQYARSELADYYLDGWKASPSHDDILRVAHVRDIGIALAEADDGMIYAAVLTGDR